MSESLKSSNCATSSSLSLLLLLSNIIFSLDFSMLLQDLGKFQKHRWLHASRMHCNVCLLVKLQLVKEVYNYNFCEWILSLQIHNFISLSQTQIGENADNLKNVESYILAGNYGQLTTLNIKDSDKIRSTYLITNKKEVQIIILILLFKVSVWIQ